MDKSTLEWMTSDSTEPDYLTMVTYTADGVSDQYEFNFPGGYLNKADIKAFMFDEEGAVRTDLTVTFVASNIVKLAPEQKAGVKVTIYRDTPKELPLVSFTDGAMIEARNLDRNAKQCIFAIAEILDKYNIVYSQVELAELYAQAAAVSATQAQEQAAFVQSVYDRFKLTDDMIAEVEVARDTAVSSASVANSAAIRAEAASQAAIASSNLYQDAAEAQAKINSGDIPNGGYFYIISPNDKEIALLYRNNSGTIVPVMSGTGTQKSIPTKEAIDAILKLIRDMPTMLPILALADSRGYIGFRVEQNGSIYSGDHIEVTPDGITLRDVGLSKDVVDLGGLRIEHADGVGLRIVGAGGYYLDIVDSSGKPAWADVAPNPDPDPEPGGWDELTFVNAMTGVAKGVAAGIANKRNYRTQAPNCNYNHFIMYGQSLSTGYEGWPALSGVDARLGNLMYGDAPRPASGGGTQFDPVNGVNAFRPLQAVVTGDGANRTVLSEIEVAALARGAGNEGESPIVSCVNYIREQYYNIFNLKSDDEHKFVASCTGVAGRSIEALSKGADPELFNRFRQAVERAKALADAEGKTYCVPAIFFAQGEWNYNSSGTNDYSEYLTLLEKLRNDMIAEVYRICGAAQEHDPAFIIYQTGAGYTSSTDLLNVGRAQLDFANNTPGVYMSGPVYQYTDKGGHLDPNGYRAFGQKFGEAYVTSCLLRDGWFPVQPVKYVRRGPVIYGSFAAPGPLNFQRPYVFGTATDYVHKGFIVKTTDGNVRLTVSSVELITDSVVKITLAQEPTVPVDVVYADRSHHGGNGCLVDMSDTWAKYNYVWNAGTGQYPEHNIPALIGKPSDMRNWCVAHRKTVEVIS
uniref:Tail fiber protein n=1 Tax=Klebsiella phage vB_Kpn1-P3 TaxID=3230838 RepID=A0AAU8ECC7_9VIRU